MIKRTLIALLLATGTNMALADEISPDVLTDTKKQNSEYLGKAMAQLKKSRPSSVNMGAIPKPEVEVQGGLVQKAMESNLVDQNTNREPEQRTKVFVSLGMEQATLKNIIKSVEKLEAHNAVIVIRGLMKDSTMRETTAYIGQLTEKHNVAVQIDPTAFERFQIKRVPAFVVYYDDPMYQASCSLTGQEESVDMNNWNGVYGDVSIKYAINHLIETGDSEFRDYLTSLDERL